MNKKKEPVVITILSAGSASIDTVKAYIDNLGGSKVVQYEGNNKFLYHTVPTDSKSGAA